MPNERAILCGNAPATNLPVEGGNPVRLRLGGGRENVSLEINDISQPMMGNLPPAFLDLVEIATYVYCADQAVTRGGDGVENLGADWRRRLFFRIPVRSVDLWSADDMREALASTLGFLSEDEYFFEFTELKKGAPAQQYLFSRADIDSDRIEEVVLFSGGLDSLGGAVQEGVIDKRRIALVTHQPSKKLSRRYKKLKEMLTERCEHTPLFIPVNINKKKNLGREYTQRSRSFLYAALGAAVAQMVGLARIRFYENGIISFNFPPSAQVVGARATRTTHPQVLNGFARILSLVAGRRFDVENPFLWRTKAEVVEGIVSAGCQETIKFSTSCTHTWEMTKLHPHCGSCSQCIDRRFATLGAGAGELDPEEGYKVKLLTDERDAGEPRTMLAAYVENANQVAQMKPLEFFSRFGEASRVLRHLNGSADTTALNIFQLHQRHAKRVTRVVDEAIATHASALRRRTLPPSCLLRLVCDATAGGAGGASTSASPTPKPPPLADYVFQKKGQAWQVRYAGGREFILLRSKGAAYLHILLANPGTPISATKLASTIALRPIDHLLGDAGDASDEDALTAYRARCEELQEDLEEAKANNDIGREEKIREEIQEIAEHIKRDTGLRGKPRKASSDRERVRKAVGNAIRRARNEIAKYDKDLADHLRSPTLRCGLNPCYNPATPPDWET